MGEIPSSEAQQSEEEEEEEVILCSHKDCMDQLSKLLRSIVQLYKHFPKGKSKRGGSTIFTNYFILRAEEIEDITLDMKDRINLHNAKISK